jgi:hypothetical protein
MAHLTDAQVATLRNALLTTTDPALQASVAARNDTETARLLNLDASPEFWVYRTRVHKSEFTNGTGPEGTTFSWTGTGFITRSVGERDAWRELFGTDGYCDPSLANVRQAFVDIFSGATAPAPANRTHLAAVARKRASAFERIFATGTGTTVSPGALVVAGPADIEHVGRALN